MPCCGDALWVEWEEDEEMMVKVRKVGGLDVVHIPGGPRNVQIGDEVEVTVDQAAYLVGGGEFVRATQAKGEK